MFGSMFPIPPLHPKEKKAKEYPKCPWCKGDWHGLPDDECRGSWRK